MTGIHIGYDLSFTHTEGAWARQGSWVGRDFPDVRMYMELAQTAERAGVGMLFFGDGSGIPSTWRGVSRRPWSGASSGRVTTCRR